LRGVPKQCDSLASAVGPAGLVRYSPAARAGVCGETRNVMSVAPTRKRGLESRLAPLGYASQRFEIIRGRQCDFAVFHLEHEQRVWHGAVPSAAASAVLS
jgi:hypothetical protein